MKCVQSLIRITYRGTAWAGPATAHSSGFGIDIRRCSATVANHSLRSALDALVKACTPTQQDADKRVQLIADIQKSLDRLYERGHLRANPFGSFVSSLYDPLSDLDLVVCGNVPIKMTNDKQLNKELKEEKKRDPDGERRLIPLMKMKHMDQIKLLKRAGRQMIGDGVALADGLEVLESARVPIIKFVSARTGLHVDLSLADEAMPFKAWTMRQLTTVHPDFERLFRVVKVWASAQTINDGAAHMLNSWCLNLLVIFFCQKHARPPLLPPIRALINPGADHKADRLMQNRRQPSIEELERAMHTFAKNTVEARKVYGSVPSKPIDELFGDFVESGARMLHRVLKRSAPFNAPGMGLSVWDGNYGRFQPYNRIYHLCVEDPYDSSDNTARTFRILTDQNRETTLHYVTAVFERAARRMGRNVDSCGGLNSNRGSRIEAEKAARADAEAEAKGRRTAGVSDPGPGPRPGPRPRPSSGAAAAAAAASNEAEASRRIKGPQEKVLEVAGVPLAPVYGNALPNEAISLPPDPTLACTLVFLFGTELLTRLPGLSEQVLGRPLFEWAQGALAAGRPFWEVHEALLQQMGAAEDFETFRMFRRRNRTEVLNEKKYAAPEELALVEPLLAGKKKLARPLTKSEKRLIKSLRLGREMLPRLRPGQGGGPRKGHNDNNGDNYSDDDEDSDDNDDDDDDKETSRALARRNARRSAGGSSGGGGDSRGRGVSSGEGGQGEDAAAAGRERGAERRRTDGESVRRGGRGCGGTGLRLCGAGLQGLSEGARVLGIGPALDPRGWAHVFVADSGRRLCTALPLPHCERMCYPADVGPPGDRAGILAAAEAESRKPVPSSPKPPQSYAQ